MNIFCELQLERIRIKIDGEEIAFQVTPRFYSDFMMKDSATGNRLRGYVHYHRSGLNLLERIQNSFKGNKVYMLVNQDVQEHTTLRHIHDYAAKYLNGRSIFIIPKPVTFDSSALEKVMEIRTEYIKGSQLADTSVAHVARTVSASGR